MRIGRSNGWNTDLLKSSYIRNTRKTLLKSTQTQWNSFETRRDLLETISELFDAIRIENKSPREIARRPQTELSEVMDLLDGAVSKDDRQLVERIVTEARYEGYIVRQQAEIKRQAKADDQAIPDWLEAWTITGLRTEAAEALRSFIPRTLGQASRLPGVSPADLTLLAVTIKRGPQATAPSAKC